MNYNLKMHTIKLKINDSIYDKLLFFLNKFDKNEIEIITDDNDFNENKKYLKDEWDQINRGKSTFFGMEDLDTRLEKVIGEYEKPENRDQKKNAD